MLVAISIPVFTSQLEKSREATDVANVRSAYAVLMADYIADGTAGSSEVAAQQQQSGWQGPGGTLTLQINGTESTYNIPAKSDKYTITIAANGTPSIA